MNADRGLHFNEDTRWVKLTAFIPPRLNGPIQCYGPYDRAMRTCQSGWCTFAVEFSRLVQGYESRPPYFPSFNRWDEFPL
ncbi:hypothetical protein M407DRAFT_245203 [Tulasnella calospora MUT 4182]|uniref:Uncharacterized protein n=1 Tax=Tulasnella calospora MUT 4182 TaxID=1051891 RepID=A0A0C3LM10_9AGAM|nr:hypothetical protein M407DRAFT_245203 [Tulasnella calospora MUT 4182]